jgi:hypothetical protein
MHDTRESDNGIVPQKPPTQEQLRLTEGAEGRPLTKGNTPQSPAALFHHRSLALLGESFSALERQAAAGVDGVTWDSYKAHLGENLCALHARLRQGRSQTQPLRRVYIPKADGTQRPLGIACLEDKIVQHAVVSVLSAICEGDFLGFSYEFRPGRGPPPSGTTRASSPSPARARRGPRAGPHGACGPPRGQASARPARRSGNQRPPARQASAGRGRSRPEGASYRGAESARLSV